MMNNRTVRFCLFLTALVATHSCSRPVTVETTGFIVDGLQVIFKETPGNPIVAGGLYLKGGANYTGIQQAGIESFLFDAATRGTKTLKKDELNASLEFMGTSFKVVARYDFTGLLFQCILDQIDPSWELFTDVLLHPRFEPEELELVRQRRIAVIEAERDQPRSYVLRIANDLLYEGHHYGVSIHGLASMAASVSRKDLIQYHRSDITKNRALLVIVGDLDLQDVTQRVRQLARQLPQGPELRLPTLVFDPGKPDLAVAQRSLPTNYILGLVGAPRPGHPEYPAFSAAMGILSDQLVEELHTRYQLSTSIGAGAAQRITNMGYIQVTAAKPDSAVMVIFQAINQMIREPLPESRLRNVLTMSITRHLLENESVANQRDQLAQWEIVGDGWEQSDQYIPELQVLKPQDIQSVMRKYLRNFHFGVVGNPRRVSKQLFTSR
ncbi:MAG: insulinase family protein [Fidelibacterota bacterium]|nr:MAG: insulinase family protein [Candidatus Neomarinimicrobiota bacterium]